MKSETRRCWRCKIQNLHGFIQYCQQQLLLHLADFLFSHETLLTLAVYAEQCFFILLFYYGAVPHVSLTCNVL